MTLGGTAKSQEIHGTRDYHRSARRPVLHRRDPSLGRRKFMLLEVREIVRETYYTGEWLRTVPCMKRMSSKPQNAPRSRATRRFVQRGIAPIPASREHKVFQTCSFLEAIMSQAQPSRRCPVIGERTLDDRLVLTRAEIWPTVTVADSPARRLRFATRRQTHLPPAADLGRQGSIGDAPRSLRFPNQNKRIPRNVL